MLQQKKRIKWFFFSIQFCHQMSGDSLVINGINETWNDECY